MNWRGRCASALVRGRPRRPTAGRPASAIWRGATCSCKPKPEPKPTSESKPADKPDPAAEGGDEAKPKRGGQRRAPTLRRITCKHLSGQRLLLQPTARRSPSCREPYVGNGTEQSEPVETASKGLRPASCSFTWSIAKTRACNVKPIPLRTAPSATCP